MNNNLIIFYIDGSKDVFSFSTEATEKDALKHFKKTRPNVQGEQIKKYFFTKEDEIPPDTYGNFFELSENGKLTMNLKSFMISKRMGEIKSRRDDYLNRLDLPFMRALEDENTQLKNHIIELKSFLRDLPEELRFNEVTEEADIVSYNPFGNIFNIEVFAEGTGYKTPPKVTIDPPRGGAFGFRAKAIAMINGGKVIRVKVIDHGSAYDYIPEVVIEPSEEGKPAFALAAPPQNLDLSQEQLLKNTQKHYEDS